MTRPSANSAAIQDAIWAHCAARTKGFWLTLRSRSPATALDGPWASWGSIPGGESGWERRDAPTALERPAGTITSSPTRSRFAGGISSTRPRIGSEGSKRSTLVTAKPTHFHLLRDALDHEVRFVFRMARDRVLLDQDDERLGRVSEVLAQCDDVLEMEVELSRRAAKPTPRSTESAREARIAKLAVRGIKTRIARPNYDRDSASLEVNLVYVREVDPPADVEPVAWVLTTTEPIGTPQQLREVIEIYRTRWLIEELFKALKTGCAFEKRQLESYETLTNALGIFLPIAWHLLLLRHQARTKPDEPAECVLSPLQIDVIRARDPKLLPLRPTAADALRAVAYLGGHFIKRPPGWLVLGRGLEKLLDLEAGWRLARGLDPIL